MRHSRGSRPFKFESLPRALQERIDGITQSVAEDIEREKREPDRERGDQHQVGNDRREATPSEIMMPQLGVGGCTPSPMKLSPASSRIAFGIARVAATMRGASVFGRRCLRMKPRAPRAARGMDVFPVLQRQELPPHQSRRGQPARQPKSEEDRKEAAGCLVDDGGDPANR